MDLNTPSVLSEFLKAYAVVTANEGLHLDMLQRLATSDPEAFMRLYNSLTPKPILYGPTYDFAAKTVVSGGDEVTFEFYEINCIYNLINAGKYVDAIRTVRIFTGWGLKEAKEVVDSCQDEITAARLAAGIPAR